MLRGDRRGRLLGALEFVGVDRRQRRPPAPAPAAGRACPAGDRDGSSFASATVSALDTSRKVAPDALEAAGRIGVEVVAADEQAHQAASDRVVKPERGSVAHRRRIRTAADAIRGGA